MLLIPIRGPHQVGFQTAYGACKKDICYSKAVCLQNETLAEKEGRSKNWLLHDKK